MEMAEALFSKMNGKRQATMILCIAVIFGVLETSGADSSLFFPHGLSEGDEFLLENDDQSTFRRPISVVFPFFDYDHRSLFVNNNGVISFLNSVSQYTPDPFPLDDGRRLLTPFWGDVDTRNGGTLSYREALRFAQDDELFLEADRIIRTSFIEMKNFVSSWMYIATWDRVAFYGAADTSIRNSFQAVMVTDGEYSFAIFNYGDINWTTGTASGGNAGTGLGGTPAQVGFNAGDGVTFYSVPGSQTAAVVDIEMTSNIGVPGRWVFRTDNSNIEGLECTSAGEINLFPLVGSMLGGTQVLVSGPCFNSTSLVVCEFDSTETSGRLLSNKTALCVSPNFYKVGRIPLRVSLDGGVTFLFRGTFTIASPEDVPDRVYSTVTESSQTVSEFEITWDADVLESVDEVDIVVYGYRENNKDVDFNGPLIILAQGIEYHLGGHNVSDIPNSVMHYDIGVIGVTESGGLGRRSDRATLWSKVHVLQWYKGNNTKEWCSEWLDREVESDKSFLKVTPPCPCTFDQAQLDIGRFSPHPQCDIDISSPSNCIHKPGAMHCIRANTPSTQGGGQVCCYDYDGMIINVFDSPGGGYSHRYHHGGVIPYEAPKKVPYLSHYLADMLPWTYCCRYGQPRDSECQNFARQRPSQLCDNYQPPPPAQGNGDPHIATLDSTVYTFNGYGEFTMLNALNDTFILQTRTAPLSGVPAATIIVAMATRYADSDVIHVQTNERRVLDAYVRLAGEGNFTRIDFDQAPRWSYTGVSVTGRNISMDGILVAFDGGVGLKLKASEGAMSILLVAPDSFRGQTQGLMGTWNGNASDDFVTPQGTLLSPNLTTEQLHYQFGLQWEIDAAESLLFYEMGTDHEYYTDRDYRPIFEAIINPFVNQTSVEEVCGTNQFCIFDYQTTGSQSFAQNSVQEFEEYEQAVDNRASFVSCPTLPVPANGSAIVSTYMAGGVARFVCDIGFELSHVVNLTCQSNGTWNDGDIPTCIEVFVPTEEFKSTTPSPTRSRGATNTPSLRSTRSSNNPTTSPSITDPTAQPSSTGLPAWSIVLISIGSVVLICVIGLIVSHLHTQKGNYVSNKETDAKGQAGAHENPTYISAE